MSCHVATARNQIHFVTALAKPVKRETKNKSSQSAMMRVALRGPFSNDEDVDALGRPYIAPFAHPMRHAH